MAEFEIERLNAAGVRSAAAELGAILLDCVEGGASVSFMAGLSAARAAGFWEDVAGFMADGRAVFVARRLKDRQLIGVVQMIPTLIENQPHRAEIAKMLVPRSARKRGVGEALMCAAEDAAKEIGRTLLVLDTANAEAARLYERLGWTRVGAIPNYALLPDGRPCSTHIYYKDLAAAVDASRVLV